MSDGHKVEGCKGRWIDIGTLSNPWVEKCSECRAIRTKPAEEGEIVDVQALVDSERRHLEGLARLKQELEENPDPVHEDEHGFWFWDTEMTRRHGPFRTREDAERAYHLWLDETVMGSGYSVEWVWILIVLGMIVASVAIYDVLRG